MAEKIGSLEFDIIGVDNLSEVTEATKKRIEGLVDSTVKGGGRMDDALVKIKQEFTKTYSQIDKVIETNISELKKLEAEQEKLKASAGKAFSSGNDEEYARIIKRQDALKGEIATRKKILSEASSSNQQLGSLEDNLAVKTQNTATAHGALRTQVRNAREELAQMEAAGQRGSVAYEQLQQKTGVLTDQMKDAQAQASILANDERGFQGIVTGLGGVSGAMSAAGGAYGLFAGENENLQKIMVKVQSLMAITIGLQQVAQTLNKDSAFMLVTVNGLKKWWNEITGKSVVVQTAEAIATKAATSAKKGMTGEIVKGTAATAGNTVATTTGTVATKGLAGGFKMVGAAIKSIPGVGWLLAGVAALIAIFTLFNKKQREAREEQEKFNKSVAEEAAKPVSKVYELSAAYTQLGNDFNAKKKFITDNKKAFDELGVAINSVAEAENALIDNKGEFIAAQISKSKGVIYGKMAEEKASKLIDAQNQKAIAEQELKIAKRQLEVDPSNAGLILIASSSEKNLKAWEKNISDIEANINQLYINAGISDKNAETHLRNAGINTNKATENETKTTSAKQTYFEKLQEEKAKYEQYEKDIKSTDNLVVSSAKEKYIELQKGGDTYLKYLENQRNKILSSDKKLTTQQQKNLDTLNKEISSLTQGVEGKSNIGEYSFSIQKEKIVQKYEKDIKEIQSKLGTVDIETGLTISEKDVEEAINFLQSKKSAELEALAKSFFPEIDFKGILNDYADYEQQRLAIKNKYDNIRSTMNIKNAQDLEAGLPATFTSENFANVDKNQSKDKLSKNTTEIENTIKNSIKLSNIFTNIQSLSKKTARETIKDTKTISDYIVSNGKTYITPELQKYADAIKSNPEELAKFYENASNLEAAYVKESGNPFEEIAYGIGQLKESQKQLEIAENATTDAAKKEATAMANIAKQKGIEVISKYATTAAGALSQMAQAMQDYADASGDSKLQDQADFLGAFASNISAAAQGAASGGWIGAIVGGAVNLLQQLITSLTNAKAESVALAKAMEGIENAAKKANIEMMLSGENRETIFGNDSYGKYLDAIEVYKQAKDDFQKAVTNYDNETLYGSTKKNWWEASGLFPALGTMQESSSFKNYKKGIEEGLSGLANMQIKTKNRNGFMEFFGAEDKYSSLADLYPNLFNSDGTINIDVAKSIKSDETLWGNLSSEQQDYFDSVIANTDNMNAALEAQKEYLSSLFGGLGDDISNSMYEAAKAGTDAMGTIEDAIDDVIDKWIQQQTYSMYIAPGLEKAQEKMEQLRGQQKKDEETGQWRDYTQEEILLEGTNYLTSYLERIKPNYDKSVQDQRTEAGLKSGIEDLNTLSGAIKGASQESIDLLAGQTNAVRINQMEAIAIQKTQLYQLTLINGGIVISNTHLSKIYDLLNGKPITADPFRATGKSSTI